MTETTNKNLGCRSYKRP